MVTFDPEHGTITGMTYEPLGGHVVADICMELHTLADEYGCPVTATVNRVEVVAHPNTVRKETIYPALEMYQAALYGSAGRHPR